MKRALTRPIEIIALYKNVRNTYSVAVYPIDTPNLPYSTKSSLFMYLSIPSYIGVVLQFHTAFIRNINLPNSDRQHYKEAYCVQEAEISF